MIASHLIASLASAANAAIDNVLRVGAAPSDAHRRGGFVAAVVLGGVRDIARAWQPILHPNGYSVRISGVFCHAADGTH